jgi:hypothetical protein
MVSTENGVICMMNYEIATHPSGARNDPHSLSLRGTVEPKQSQWIDAGDCHAPINRGSQ